MVRPFAASPSAPPRFIRFSALASVLLLLVVVPQSAQSDCLGLGPTPVPNVLWGVKDSVSACPAADTLTSLVFPPSVGSRPSKLRITLFYSDANCDAKTGVPPESIWVTTSTQFGNLKANDTGAKIFADDSTNALGFARITVGSLSGCGRLRVTLYVSGVSQGPKTVTARTTDKDADGRTTSSDSPPCDLNYNGTAGDANDLAAALDHLDHWRRNVLFGTLVRRTNLCETCAVESTGTIGDSEVFWSPDGKLLAFTVHTGSVDADTVAACKVFLVRSDPKEANALTQFTFPDSNLHDYDPSWSPLGDLIAFDRDDRRILRKGIPGANPDTGLYLVTASGDQFNSGDATPAISPHGQWVAFSRRDAGPRHMWKVPITGGTPTQLTFEADGVDFYPQWTSDGNWITFDRQNGASDQPHHVYKVKSNGDSLQAVFDAPAGQDAATPAFSPDGMIITLGVGTHTLTNPPRDVTTRTLDPGLAVKKILPYFADITFAVQGPDPVLSPRLSPDGTRLALRSKQLWAARRNMSLPPQFTSIGAQPVADSTTVVFTTMSQEHPGSVVVSASDPENDPLTYAAYFLQLGMQFSPTTRTFTWFPPGGTAGHTYYVRFQVGTPSGGTDAIILAIYVDSALRARGARDEGESFVVGPNPTRGHFVLSTPYVRGATAGLSLHDVGGRKIATIRGRAGARLEWDGRDASGALVPPGVYLYRMEVAQLRRQGAVTVLR